MKKFLLCVVCAAALGGCNKNDSEKTVEPTAANLEGVWKARSSRIDNKNVKPSYYQYDYLIFTSDPRFYSGYFDVMQTPYYYGEGAVERGQFRIGSQAFQINSLTAGQLSFAFQGRYAYQGTFERVSNPTTYSVSNQSSYKPAINISTYVANEEGEYVMLSKHGTLSGGETSPHKIYAEFPDSIYLQCIPSNTMVQFATVYPQAVTRGKTDNLVILADTTTIYEQNVREAPRRFDPEKDRNRVYTFGEFTESKR